MSTHQPRDDSAAEDQSENVFENVIGANFFEPSAFATPLRPRGRAPFLEESMFTTPPPPFQAVGRTRHAPRQTSQASGLVRTGGADVLRSHPEADDRGGSHGGLETPETAGRRSGNDGVKERDTSGRAGPQNTEEKLTRVLGTLKDVGWSMGDFLYHVFRLRDEHGSPVRHDGSLGTKIGRFLSGRNKHTAIEIISYWLEDERGRPKRTHDEHALQYSPDADWKNIKHARVAITAMSVQLCKKRMRREQRTAVKGSSGLHGSAVGKHGHRELRWEDISKSTVAEVQEILTTFQPLCLHLIESLATPAPRKNDAGNLIHRASRPPALIATEILSSLNFSRTHFARRLPAARGVLFFASLVPRVVFDYCSRVGVTPSWSTVYVILSRLARQDADALAALGRDETVWLVLRGDNVQHQHKQRERRLGRESAMKIGFAGTAAEVQGFDPAAADLDDRLRRVSENLRSKLTVDQLTSELVDLDGIEVALELQWLQVLVNHVPCLAHYKPQVAKLFRTDAAKLLLPTDQKTRIHALAPSAKNEAITTDLRDIVVDMMEQIGQRNEDYTRRLIPVGGDGLTFEKLVDLKNKMQWQSNELQRFDLVFPFLETWHTEWTFLSLVFETHWGDALTPDPSKLGHSATKINQKAPPNLKKVDYYPALYTAYTIADARMLDCWRIVLECDDLLTHFDGLASSSNLPTIDALRIHARNLHRNYSTQEAYIRAMQGGEAARAAGWRTGSAWEAPRHADDAMRNLGRPKETTVGEETPCSEHPTADVPTDVHNNLSRPPSSSGDSSEDAPADRHNDLESPPLSSSGESGESNESDDNISETPAAEEEALRAEEHGQASSPAAEPPPFIGDRTLAQSVLFLRDTMVSREAAQAVGQGDVGRLWNALKMMAIFFAGSGHTKYTTYLLEMICIIELESSPALRDVFLRNWLINPSGEPGRTIEGDLFEEHMNLLLEEVIEKKGAEWDSRFIREVLAPCILHFMELKNEWGIGVGLAKRRARHPEPHSRPEIRTLLETYRELELHLFRPGRSYPSSSDTVNTFQEGAVNLEKTKLKKFVSDSMRVRLNQVPGDSEPNADDEVTNEVDSEEPEAPQTRGRAEMVDGELVVTYGSDEEEEEGEVVSLDWIDQALRAEEDEELWDDHESDGNSDND